MYLKEVVMKRKSTLLVLALALAVCLSSFQAAFAAAPPTDATREAIKKSGIQTTQKIKNELDAEAYMNNFQKEVKKGKYKIISTAELKNGLSNFIIIDTMPESWYSARHIPGATCQVVGAMNGPEFKILPDEQKALLSKVNKLCGKKTYYYNKKTKKWQSKKIKGAKKKKMVNKDKKIVVYCGFMGCARSHQAAMFLTKKGFTNVYRYAGGISAWVDANNEIEGTDVG